MSEHIPSLTPENYSPPPETSKKGPELPEADIESTPQGPTPEDQIDSIRRTIEDAASPAAKVEQAALRGTTSGSSTPSYTNKELKVAALNRTLKHLQHELPPVQRLLSKTIHQPAIRRVSAATGQTVGRPSGLLGGGLCAFLGSLIYLYLAKHIGFSYNYLLFFVLFLGGFVVGVILELLLSLAIRSGRSRS